MTSQEIKKLIYDVLIRAGREAKEDQVCDVLQALNERIDELEQRIRFLDDGFSGDVRAFGNRLAELEERIDKLEKCVNAEFNEVKHQLDDLA